MQKFLPNFRQIIDQSSNLYPYLLSGCASICFPSPQPQPSGHHHVPVSLSFSPQPHIFSNPWRSSPVGCSSPAPRVAAAYSRSPARSRRSGAARQLGRGGLELAGVSVPARVAAAWSSPPARSRRLGACWPERARPARNGVDQLAGQSVLAWVAAAWSSLPAGSRRLGSSPSWACTPGSRRRGAARRPKRTRLGCGSVEQPADRSAAAWRSLTRSL
jgi:hypothetical protein